MEELLEKKLKRTEELKTEFQRSLDFFNDSFEYIDNKARYWLTLILPSLVALAGYLLNNFEKLPSIIVLLASASAVILLAATWHLSSVLISKEIDSGIISPVSGKVDDISPYTETDEKWLELLQNQIEAKLLAEVENSKTLEEKSKSMNYAEVCLFRTLPFGLASIVVLALLYFAAFPSWCAAFTIVPNSTWAALGSVGGFICLIASWLIVFCHR